MDNSQNVMYATMTFSRKELLYDIENRAFTIGDATPEDHQHAKHIIIDVAQDGYVDYVTRMLALAHAECAEFLFSLSKVPCEGSLEYNNDQQDLETYTVTLAVSADISQTTLNLISKLIHEYMVCYALRAHIRLVGNPSSYWDEMMDDIKNKIRTRLNARCGRVRRTQSPF